MVSKHSAVRSIRLPNETWEWLAAEAEKRKTTVNGLVAAAVAMLRGSHPVAALKEFEGPTTLYASFAPPAKAAPKVKIKPIPPGPMTWPSGVVIEPHHTEDPGIEAPRVTVAVPLMTRKAFNPQPKKGKK